MKRSSNTTGNPYHDDAGRFTTKDAAGGAGVSSADKSPSAQPSAKLKPGVDLQAIAQSMASAANQQPQPAQAPRKPDLSAPPTMPTSIGDAEEQGNRILGSSGAVGYADDTSLEVAHNFNRALFDMASIFPRLFDNEQLYLYGTTDRRAYGDKAQVRADERNLISSVLSSPAYVSRLAGLKMSQKDIMDTMTKALHMAKKVFADDPDKGVGGFTGMADYSQMSHMINTHNIIKFNAHYSRDMSKWDRYPKQAIRAGHFLPIGGENGAYMVACHELGHHVFEKLFDLMDDGDKNTLNSLLWRETNGVKDAQRLHALGAISGYATTNRHEHMAEAFANVMCMVDGATEHNKRLIGFMGAVYDKIYGDGD